MKDGNVGRKSPKMLNDVKFLTYIIALHSNIFRIFATNSVKLAELMTRNLLNMSLLASFMQVAERHKSVDD